MNSINMKFIAIFLICFVCISNSFAEIQILQARIPYKIKNFFLQKCENNPQQLDLENVSVTTNNGDLVVSGKLLSSINLTSPIKVSVNMKRKILGFWVKVPCIRKLGSCTYQDVCQYGIPANTTCPKKFEQNNIPCRCPIQKGEYILPKGFTIPKEYYEENIIGGKYNGQIIVESNLNELACYRTSFTLY